MSSTSLINEGDLEEKANHDEVQAVGTVKMGVYGSYFKAVDSFIYIGFIVVMFIFAQGLVSAVDLYVSQW